MIFDETSYSATWCGNFPLSPVNADEAGIHLPRIETHHTLGAVKDANDHWRFEPGLGVDFELSHSLLLSFGFKLTFSNDQVFELIQLEPGVFTGRIPARATPELFATDQEPEQDGECSFLTNGDYQVGLFLQSESIARHFVLCIHPGDREACKQKLLQAKEDLPKQLAGTWESQLGLRQIWTARLPEHLVSENPGLAIERIQGLIAPASGIFKGPWIRDPSQPSPTLSFQLSSTVLSALAVTQPEIIPEFLNTLLHLPPMENGAWASAYTPEGPSPDAGPALPAFSSILATLPRDIPGATDLPALHSRCKQHIQSFINGPKAAGLPQWAHPHTAFTPEVTDPEALIQFDLAALLVTEIEALQKLTQNPAELESERKEFISGILTAFWSEKRKRFLDKTPGGAFASRVTAGTLLPLLWKRLDKKENTALRQCLLNTDELRSQEGLRQWEPKKDDPVSPPVHAATQQLFLPLLGTLNGETAALLSADWHRSLQKDPHFQQPETAALHLRLIPFASRINPHLERYPAWVRSMEKHRQIIVSIAAAILLLIPAGFGIYFTVRSDYNRSDELLQSGHAETLVTLGDLKGAEEVYTELLTYARIDTRKNVYYLNRGNLRFKQGQYEQALADYEMAVELDPIGNLYKARWNLGQTYARLGRIREASATLQGFIDEYGEELPSYKRRAEHAMTLWQE
ncbi:tetratricopeptide repeat protein [Kiritimatiellaeota bacterium B1221]|nr:tetratricopeptide repeat protein [Kiritimatiellaeota bacterium B1221]